MNLTASQLADLVNYVLGLPVKLGQWVILEPSLHPCVVSTWSNGSTANKSARIRAEVWCEAILRQAGVLPKEVVSERHTHPGGRYCAVPKELQRIAPKAVGRVEQMRESRRVAG